MTLAAVLLSACAAEGSCMQHKVVLLRPVQPVAARTLLLMVACKNKLPVHSTVSTPARSIPHPLHNWPMASAATSDVSC